jgi:hypothetical protein
VQLSSDELSRGEATHAAFVQNALNNYSDGRPGAEFTLFGRLLKGMAKSAFEGWAYSLLARLRERWERTPLSWPGRAVLVGVA